MTTHSFTACPDCGEITEISDRFVLASTDGPIEHVRMLCIRRHWFMLAVASLDRLSSPMARQDPTPRLASPLASIRHAPRPRQVTTPNP